ncbi:4'-phosphopantetheinyl transferase superfamily protein [Streptomyces sp. NPDC001904]|uniref:4'-phosphopantetheinyl transferase family protein n=1 Tax=Streptomyces sp. NPDC001904 TaxID=3154531 RepID=UPI00332523D4
MDAPRHTSAQAGSRPQGSPSDRSQRMIRDLVPRGIAAVESFGTPPPSCFVYPEESAIVARAVPGRRNEFGAVRDCARLAMAELGFAPAPVLRGSAGDPIWPTGLVGSMAHCAGYQVAVIARADEVAAVGVDAEPNEPLPENGMLEMVGSPGECDMVAELAGRFSHINWDRLLFSAKESIYKAWYPFARRWLGFEDAVVRLDPRTGTFTARLLTAGPVVAGDEVNTLAGRWISQRGLLLTVITVPRPAGAGPVDRSTRARGQSAG